MKKSSKVSMIAIAAVLVVVVALSCVLVACNKKPSGPATDPKAATFVNIDVNPSLELVLDENNKVLDVKAANEDAQILIHGEKGNGIIGSQVDVAVKNIGKLSVEMGYVSEDNNHINISVVGESDIDTTAIYNTVKSNITTGVGQVSADLQCVVENGIDLAYKKELEAIQAKYKDVKNIQDLTLPRYRLVRSAMLHKFGLTFIKACELSNGELAEIVASSNENVKAAVNSISAETMKEVTTAYQNAKTISKDLAYIASLDVSIWQTDDFLRALNYVSSHVYELCMKQSYDVYKFLALDVEYDQDAVTMIANKLYGSNEEAKADFTEHAKNANGKYTKNSIMQYANKEFRNMTEQARAEFNTKYDQAEEIIEAELNKTHNLNISAQMDDFTTEMSVSFGFDQKTVDKLKSGMDSFQNDLNGFFGNLLNKEPAEVRFEKEIKKAEEQRAKALTKLEENMTDEQLTKVAEKQASYDKFVNEFETAYNNAKAKFDAEANDWLEKTQEARLNQYNANKAA